METEERGDGAAVHPAPDSAREITLLPQKLLDGHKLALSECVKRPALKIRVD